MADTTEDSAQLKKSSLIRFIFGFLFIGILLFASAGTLRYWQAWLYLTVHCVAVGLFLRYLIREDPALLRRRMQMREPEKTQKAVIAAAVPFYSALFIIPGMDRRFGWSSVPPWIVGTALFAALTGYALFVRVLLENRFAQRIVAIDREQKLITTGPYSFVRHPMYSAVILTIAATPVALGSFWALCAVPGIVACLAVRIRNEEEVMSRGLDGYEAYRRRVRRRVIPGIW